MKKNNHISVFDRISLAVAKWMAHPLSFLAACLVVIIWAITGPYLGYSDTWQLIINTGTTIMTFLMVFLIQNTQSRDTRTLHLKVDELIRAVQEADTALIALDKQSKEDLDKVENKLLAEAEKTKEIENSNKKKASENSP